MTTPTMTPETREELARAIGDSRGSGDEATGVPLWDVLDFSSENAARCTIMGAVDAIAPIIERLVAERVAAETERCAGIACEHRARIAGHDPDDQSPPDMVAQGYGNAALNIEAAIRSATR